MPIDERNNNDAPNSGAPHKPDTGENYREVKWQA